MRTKPYLALLATAVLACATTGAAAQAECENRQYVFSWSMEQRCTPEPRGGTTVGVPVTLAETPSDRWQALQEADLSQYERDRRAILAMAGGYRTSFEFVETIAYPIDYELARPYHSWGTEYVYVIADEGDFISLQHIMVMFYQGEDGKVEGPMVMKHWRQDWQYEGRELLEYRGNNTWRTRRLDKDAVQGGWSQTVYHVDDSPRYAAVGRWRHNNSFSAWQSDETWRPLPRREHSARDDYDVLEGFNHHVVLPTGWVHEQENRKLKLAQTGVPADMPYLAKELGNNRYQHVVGFDFSAGDRYWQETGPYWKVVREQWEDLFARHPEFRLREEHQGVPLFAALFQLAERYRQGQLNDVDDAVSSVLDSYVVAPPG